MKARVEKAAALKLRYAAEETNLEEQIRRGNLTEQEAHKRFARAHMRKQSEKGPGIDTLVAAAADYQTTEAMIEEVLDDDADTNPTILYIKTILGIRNLERKVRAERSRRKSPNFVHPAPLVERFVTSVAFEFLVCLSLIGNAYMVSITVAVADQQDESLHLFFLFEHIFTVLFLVEIGFRFLAHGWTWIWNTYNMADVLLMFCTGILPLWILAPIFGVNSNFMRSFQVARGIRMVRMAYLTRFYLTDLWMLISNLTNVGTMVVSAFAMLFGVTFIMGTIAVFFIGRSPDYLKEPLTELRFGVLWRSMLTLLQFALYDDWVSLSEKLMEHGPVAIIIFFAFFVLVPITLLNVIRAVILANMVKTAKEDEDALAKMRAKERQREIRLLKSVFLEIDQDGSGTLDKAEFDDAVRNHDGIKHRLSALGVGENEAEEIWFLLDPGDGEGGTGELTVDQFTDGLLAVQNEARARDSFSMVKRTRVLNQRIERMIHRVDSHLNLAMDLRSQAQEINRQFGGTMVELEGFVRLMMDWVPSKSATRPKDEFFDFHKTLNQKAAMSALNGTDFGFERLREQLQNRIPTPPAEDDEEAEVQERRNKSIRRARSMLGGEFDAPMDSPMEDGDGL
jgi:hypothetical protein